MIENSKRLDITAKAEAAFRQAAAKVVLRAKQTNTPVIVWRDGAARAVPASEFDDFLKEWESRSKENI